MWIFKRSEALDNFVVLGPNVLAEITLAAVYSECRKGIFFRPDNFFFSLDRSASKMGFTKRT